MTDELIALLAADLKLTEQDVRAALLKLLSPQVLAVHAASVEAAERAAKLQERQDRERRRVRASMLLKQRWTPP
jgi:hypothetical protein